MNEDDVDVETGWAIECKELEFSADPFSDLKVLQLIKTIFICFKEKCFFSRIVGLKR